MSALSADTPIEYLKGVGPQRAEMLRKELNIHTVYDLLHFYPFRYVDKSKSYRIADIQDEDTYYQFKAKIIRVQEVGAGAKKRLTVMVEDESGQAELVWFKGFKYVKPNLHVGKEYIIFGKPTRFQNRYNFTHPEIEESGSKMVASRSPLQSIYHSGEKLASKGLTSRGIEKLLITLLREHHQSARDLASKYSSKKRSGRQNGSINPNSFTR